MATLSSLPEELIVEIALTLQGPPRSSSADEWKFDPPLVDFSFPVQDVLSLSMCNKELRWKCGEVTWRCLRLGMQEDDQGYGSKLRGLLHKDSHILEHVRHVQTLDVMPCQVQAMADCIKAMPHLTHYSHEQASPVPTVVACALCSSPTLEALYLSNFAVESLPALQPLASKIRYLSLSAIIAPILLPAMVPHAPITVGRARRMKLPLNRRNMPTQQEQKEALNEQLALFLAKCAGQLEYLQVEEAEKTDFGGSVAKLSISESNKRDWLQKLLKTVKEKPRGKELPRFGKLRYLRLSPAAFTPAMKHLLGSAPELRSVDFSSGDYRPLAGPAVKLQNLKSLYYLSNGFIDVGKPVSAFISGSQLTSLGLSGAKLSDLDPLFSSAPSSLALLHTLYLELGPGGPSAMAVTLHQLKDITIACPKVEKLTLLAPMWMMRPEQLLTIISRSLRRLVSFRFNHSLGAAPDLPGMPNMNDPRYPSGIPTIRSPTRDRAALVMRLGRTVEEEVRIRIQNDIDEARTFYRAMFLQYTKDAANSLQRIVWSANKEVKWEFRFERDAKNKVKMTDEATIDLADR